MISEDDVIGNDTDLLLTNRGAPNEIVYNDGGWNFSRTARFGRGDDSTISVAIAVSVAV